MKRESIVYKVRRRLQVIAHKLFSDEIMSKFYFKIVLNKSLNLRTPKTFNEKLQWLKLYYWPNDLKAIMCADKYAVRSYIEDVGKKEILNEIFFVWNDPDEIQWNKLPNQFVLKCNHGCGYNIICSDKSKLDEVETKRKLHRWINEDFSKFNAEPHYSKIPRKIICEKYLGPDIINYNIYVLNGKVQFFSVAGGLGDGVGEHLTYYNADGTIADFKNKSYPTNDCKLSDLLPKMIETAEFLAKEFPMVRVDLFDVEGRMVLSEMTFTPGGGLIPFQPDKADEFIGNRLDISNLEKKV